MSISENGRYRKQYILSEEKWKWEVLTTAKMRLMYRFFKISQEVTLLRGAIKNMI